MVLTFWPFVRSSLGEQRKKTKKRSAFTQSELSVTCTEILETVEVKIVKFSCSNSVYNKIFDFDSLLEALLLLNPLTPRVKPQVIQSFLTFDSMDRTLKCETIHCKAAEQYFTVVLFVIPLTPRVKPLVIQSFLTFDSMDRTLKCSDNSLESYLTVLYCGAVCRVHMRLENPLISEILFQGLEST